MNAIANSSFLTDIPFQFAWDSTSLGTFKECPRKYYYTMVLGFTTRSESIHLSFGRLYHSALELYDHKRSAGASYDDALDAVVDWLMNATVIRTQWGFKPWDDSDPNKNRFTLVRTVVWYLEQFRDDACQTIQLANGKPAVELSFRFDTGTKVDGHPLIMCGHLDRVVSFNDDIWVLDRKTTKSTMGSDFFAKFNPDNQMSLYSFAANIVYSVPVKGVIIDGAQIAVGFSRFQRGMTLRTEDQLNEWFDSFRYYTSQAYAMAKAEFWPMNDKSCGNYGGCPFRIVCAKPPSTREQWLKADYSNRTWDPLQIRGDV